MAIRTTRFVAFPSVPVGLAGWWQLYTCPPDKTALIKDYTFVNRTGASRTMALAVRTGGVECRVHPGGLVATSGALTASGRDIVLLPGDALVLYVGGENASSAIDGCVFGALLDGVAV